MKSTRLPFDEFCALRFLLTIEGIGPVKINHLQKTFPSFLAILDTPKNLLAKTSGLHDTIISRIFDSRHQLDKLHKTIERELDALKQTGASIITIWDDDYPFLLRNIYAPPPILYVAGEIAAEDENTIAVVGTRTPSQYGKMQAEKISAQLSESGFTVVSGLARGIDSIAHLAALETGGKTIAVIGSGFGHIYPKENIPLADSIRKSGAVLTTHPYFEKAVAMNFPARNRIISGLSRGTVIVESGSKGGALQTASFALEQNREVFAIPGNIGSKQSEGTNNLIKHGTAKLVQHAEDILSELQPYLPQRHAVKKEVPKVSLSLFEEKIVTALGEETLHIDTLANKAGFSTQEALVHLLTLEFKGVIRQLPGKMFVAVQ